MLCYLSWIVVVTSTDDDGDVVDDDDDVRTVQTCIPIINIYLPIYHPH
jgi:hypothetical protein